MAAIATKAGFPPWSGTFLCLVISRVEQLERTKKNSVRPRKTPPSGA
jgi:hypothetical protein